jgi:hypothetical protein
MRGLVGRGPTQAPLDRTVAQPQTQSNPQSVHSTSPDNRACATLRPSDTPAQIAHRRTCHTTLEAHRHRRFHTSDRVCKTRSQAATACRRATHAHTTHLHRTRRPRVAACLRQATAHTRAAIAGRVARARTHKTACRRTATCSASLSTCRHRRRPICHRRTSPP